MANEVTNALLVTNGGRLPEDLGPIVQTALYDATDLTSTMVFVPPVGRSSTTSVTIDAVGVAAAAAASEISGGFSNAAYTTAEKQLTVAGYGAQREISDLLGLTAGAMVPGSKIDLEHIVMRFSEIFGLTMTDLLCALFPSLSNSVGTSGADLTTSDMYSAMYQLITSLVPASDGIHAVLHPQQYRDFIASLRGETGSDALSAETAAHLQFSGPGFRGMWKGCAIWTADSVSASGGNRRGAMYSGRCFGYTHADMTQLVPSHYAPEEVLLLTSQILVARQRSYGNPLSQAIAWLYPAVVELDDARGVLIATDE